MMISSHNKLEIGIAEVVFLIRHVYFECQSSMESGNNPLSVCLSLSIKSKTDHEVRELPMLMVGGVSYQRCAHVGSASCSRGCVYLITPLWD